MAVATVNDYLAALEKSKLLDAEQFARAQSLAAGHANAPDLARALARENLVSRWQAGTLLALGKRAQLRLGKYRLIERLGKGGMGTVFLAAHVRMNRRVALKIVPRSIAKDRAALDRFFAEARAIAALDHPNIVQAYSVDNEMDRYFIVMEYVDGQDLQRMVETTGPMEFDRAADYIRQAAEGLGHAHARNLVHCDVKPSNLLLNNQGVIKILDLGLARLNESDDGRDSSGPTFGTVDYMAPEQALAAADLDYRADIYSLGCTLYFLLTGHPPFPDGTLAQRIVKHQTQEPRDILTERPGTPAVLAILCRRMMAKQPEERCRSMQEVSAALAPLVAGNTGPANSLPRAVKPIAEAPVNGQADDWLMALVRETTAPSASDSGISLAAKSGKRAAKNRPADGSAASAGLAALVREKLAWFNTAPRRVLGAVCGLAALAAVAALAAMPLLFSQSPPATLMPAQAKAPENSKTGESDTAALVDTSQAKKPAPSASPAKTDPPATTPGTTTRDRPPPPDTKPQPVVPPKPPTNPPKKKSTPPAAPTDVVKVVALDGLLAAADVPPARDTAAAVPLGKLESAAKTDLDIHLLGGDTIAKGNPKFSLRKEDGAKVWSVLMGERNNDDTTIARLFLEGGECKFQWTSDARERAWLLRFCGVQFSSGHVKHVTLLTAPKPVGPLLIDLDSAVNRPPRRFLSREFALPDASMLRLQILPLDPSMPKHKIKVVEKGLPGRAVHGRLPEMTEKDTVPNRGHALIVLSKGRTPPVTFQIGFDVRGKDAVLDTQATCEISGQPLQFSAGVVENHARLARVIASSESASGRTARTAPGKEMVQAAKAASVECKALQDLLVELRKQVSIPFRVYVVAGRADDNTAPKVVIFQGDQVEESKAAEPNNNKANRPKGRKLRGDLPPDEG
jgi:serine/threonine protein kinase